MKNINITTEFYNSDLSVYSGPMQFGKVIDCIKAKQGEDNKYYIDELTIATQVCAISSNSDPELSKKLKIRWTLGTLISDEATANTFEYFVVSDAEFNPFKNRKEKIPNGICRHFSNQTFKFTLRDYEISHEGEYYLKVFIQGENESVWTLQSMNYIKIEF